MSDTARKHAEEMVAKWVHDGYMGVGDTAPLVDAIEGILATHEAEKQARQTVGSPQWEYRNADWFEPRDGGTFEGWLNSMGAEGWELCRVQLTYGVYYCTFKRPRKELLGPEPTRCADNCYQCQCPDGPPKEG
jgi:hypothetical protein